MKRNYIANITAAVMLLAIACKQPVKHTASTPAAMEMEHSYRMDSSLLPLLQPVNEQVLAQIGTVQPVQQQGAITREIQGVVTYDTRSEASIASRVSGRIEQLYIKYNYQPVKKGQLLMLLYSPELVAAQRELLFIRETGDDAALLNSAKQRLQLLGMPARQIAQVLQSRQPVYKIPVYSNANGYIIDKTAATQPAAAPQAAAPGNNTATPVLLREGQYVNAGETLFTIYKADKLVAEFALEPSTAAHIHKGQSITLQSSTDTGKTIAATVGLIQPAFRNGENFTLLRAYLQGQPFSAGTLLKAQVPVMEKAAWWLPEAAVLQLGTHSVVFRKQGAVYKPVTIAAGLRAGGQVQVPDSIAGWQVARNAYYLVDSESFIKTAATKQP